MTSESDLKACQPDKQGREKFEAWYKYRLEYNETGKAYLCPYTHQAWLGYKARDPEVETMAKEIERLRLALFGIQAIAGFYDQDDEQENRQSLAVILKESTRILAQKEPPCKS